VELEDRVAIVTGGAGGIGAAFADRLLREGARVVLADLDADRVEAVTEELAAVAPGRVEGVAGDASSEEGIRELLDHAGAAFGDVDIYLANAGVPGQGGLEVADADWGLAFDVNVMAHVRAARLLVPGWIERGEGVFVATASAAGLLTQIGAAPYAVTKHAAVAFAEWLSITYGDRGLQVACVCPMGVDTAMLADGLASSDQAQRRSAEVVASAGSVLPPTAVADAMLEALRERRFLVLPHPEVATFARRRADDPDRWLAGMRRLARGPG
jgi:NAD(P)-dependent dehydrogenase (short-subunit alcohol dehydrogenase family)